MCGWSSCRRNIGGTFIGWIRFRMRSCRLLAERGITGAVADWAVGAQRGFEDDQAAARATSMQWHRPTRLKDITIAEDLGGRGGL